MFLYDVQYIVQRKKDFSFCLSLLYQVKLLLMPFLICKYISNKYFTIFPAYNTRHALRNIVDYIIHDAIK